MTRDLWKMNGQKNTRTPEESAYLIQNWFCCLVGKRTNNQSDNRTGRD